MNEYLIKKQKNNIYELRLVKHPDSCLTMKLLKNSVYCAVSTHVFFDDRGHGIGKLLYQAMIDYIRKQKAKFNAACSFIMKQADLDKTVKDIYLPNL
ncbi:MAG: N-acetyltransferase [Mycoplasmataceae bacterium]|jgi:predicted GNAT family acetyltransferase|nr:N-acetyltransferase [Mycoplasmataceae bacterium]